MAIVACPSCGRRTPDWSKTCRGCGVALTLRGRKQQESDALADRIAESTSDEGYARWQRSVIMNVVHGGGTAGFLLVLSAVMVCSLAFILAHRLVSSFTHADGTPYSGGALFYLSIVVPAAVLYFRLAAPFFYRLHKRISRNQAGDGL